MGRVVVIGGCYECCLVTVGRVGVIGRLLCVCSLVVVGGVDVIGGMVVPSLRVGLM